MESKTIFITGTSSGFGKLAAESLVRRGHRVIAGIRGGEERLRSVYPREPLETGRLHAVDLHLERPETLDAAVRETLERTGGRLDVLVNNAGYGLLGPFERMDATRLEHQMQVNFHGPMTLIRGFLPALRESRGRVINVSSTVGTVSLPFYSAYSASKFALEGATEALYYELRPFGIQVALVEPGGFKTEFMNTSVGTGRGGENDPLYGARLARFNRYVLEKSGSFSGGDPARVARLLVRLCEKRRIPIRNFIGMDAWTAWIAKWLLPENLRLRIQERLFRKVLFGE